MSDLAKEYTASIFGNFQDIEPTTDNIQKLLVLFEKQAFIPGTFYEISLEDLSRLPRIVLSNNDSSIHIFQQRIDFITKIIEGDNITIDGFLDDANNAFSRIINEYNKKSSRIALIIKKLLKEISATELDDLYYKYIIPINFYKQNPPKEWSFTQASQIKGKINDKSETINVLVTIRRIQGKLKIKDSHTSFDTIEQTLDTSTDQSNLDTRFEGKDLKEFFNISIKLRSILNKDIGVADDEKA